MDISTPIPKSWGSDKLSDFCNRCHHNTVATHVNAPDAYRKLAEVDALFWVLRENLVNSPHWFSALFAHHTHMSFLGAARLALAGQFAEVYPLARSTLEYALHAFHFRGNEDAQETWLRRSDSSAAKDTARRQLTAAKMLKSFAAVDRETHMVASRLYEHFLDFGGHPNDGAVLAGLKQHETEDRAVFTQKLLDALGTPQRLVLKDSAAAGTCGLRILRSVWPERFDIIGLTERLNRLCKEI